MNSTVFMVFILPYLPGALLGGIARLVRKLRH